MEDSIWQPPRHGRVWQPPLQNYKFVQICGIKHFCNNFIMYIETLCNIVKMHCALEFLAIAKDCAVRRAED